MVSRFQNPCVRTVIYRQGKFFCRKPPFQGKKGTVAGTSPAVDYLVWVPHGKKPGLLSHQSFQKFQLEVIAVLDFICDHPGGVKTFLFYQLGAYQKQVRKTHFVLPLFLLFQQRVQPEQVVPIPGNFSSFQISLVFLLQALFQPVLIFDIQFFFFNNPLGQLCFFFRFHYREVPVPAGFFHRELFF